MGTIKYKTRSMLYVLLFFLSSFITVIINCEKSNPTELSTVTDIDLYVLPSSGSSTDSQRFINDSVNIAIDVYFPEYLDSIAYHCSIDTVVYGISKNKITALNIVTYTFDRPCTAMVYAQGFSGGTVIISDSIAISTIEEPGTNQKPQITLTPLRHYAGTAIPCSVFVSDSNPEPWQKITLSVENLDSGYTIVGDSLVIITPDSTDTSDYLNIRIRATDNGQPPLFSEDSVSLRLLHEGDVPPVPHNFVLAEKGIGYGVLQWNGDSITDRYRIYKSKDRAENSWDTISSDDTLYIDSVQENFYYYVTSLNFFGESEPSGIIYSCDTLHFGHRIFFNDSALSFWESDSLYSLPVIASRAAHKDITLWYSVEYPTDQASSQDVLFTDTTFSLTIPKDSSKGSILFTMIDDNVKESNESFLVRLDSCSSGFLDSSTYFTGIIIDNDAVTISFVSDTATITESDTTCSLSVTLSCLSTDSITVNYKVSEIETQADSADFTLLGSGMLTFKPGEVVKQIGVTIHNDTLAENAKKISIILADPFNSRLGVISKHTLTLVDDDALYFSFDQAETSTIEQNDTLNIPVSLNIPSRDTVKVTISINSSKTTANSDQYSLITRYIAFDPGKTHENVRILNVDNNQSDGARKLVIQIDSIKNTQAGKNSIHTVSIQDDESINISFVSAESQCGESDSLCSIKLTLSEAVPIPVTVNYVIDSNVTTAEPADYLSPSGTYTFAAGSVEAFIEILLVSDSIHENNECIVLAFSSKSGLSWGSQKRHTITIVDNDTSHINFQQTTSSVSENSDTVKIPVKIDPVRDTTVTVQCSVKGRTSQSEDFSLLTPFITFGPKVETQEIKLLINDDPYYDPDKTVILVLVNPAEASLGSDSIYTLTITDNDTKPNVQFEKLSIRIKEDTAPVNIPILLSNLIPDSSTCYFHIDNTKTTADSSDYSFTSLTHRITNGQSSKSSSFSLSILNNAIDEYEEQIVIVLDSASGIELGQQNTITVIIEDDDPPVSVTFSSKDTTVGEISQTINVLYNLSSISLCTVVVDIVLSAQSSATSNSDFILPISQFIIPPGKVDSSISISITNDQKNERNETVILKLAAKENCTLGSIDSHVVIIKDDDIVPPEVLCVDLDAIDGGNGKSWPDAFNTIQDALQNAQEGSEIWVKAGHYQPGDERNSTYQIDKPNISIFGGFASGEITRDARNWKKNKTIITGDLGGADRTTNIKRLINIVSAASAISWFSDYVIDGLTLTLAYNDDDKAVGAAMNIEGENITIQNCTFTDNYAKSNGNAIHVKGKNISISNCFFVDNPGITSAQSDAGGAIYISGGGGQVEISASIFKNNSAYYRGGAIWTSDSCTIKRSAFINNKTSSLSMYMEYIDEIFGGGAIYSHYTTLTLENCIFANNSTNGLSAGILDFGSKINMANCTFNNNQLNNEGKIFNGKDYLSYTLMAEDPNDTIILSIFNSGTYFQNQNHVFHSVFDSNKSKDDSSNIRPYNQYEKAEFVDENNIFGRDGILFTEDDGLRQKTSSNGINIKDPASKITPLPFPFSHAPEMDITNKVSRPASGWFDIGAYEQ